MYQNAEGACFTTYKRIVGNLQRLQRVTRKIKIKQQKVDFVIIVDTYSYILLMKSSILTCS